MQIYDKSGDKEFFTIIPNYIANHSSANDQALYLQMKRFAGEGGKCFASQETIMKKLRIGRTKYNESLNYLIKKGWISYIGMTKGKTRPIKTYKINNIWRLNSDYYKKIPSRTAVSFKKIPSRMNKDTVQNSSKIPSRTAVEEDPVLIRSNNKIIPPTPLKRGDAGKPAEINQIFDIFYKKINPTISWENKTQRRAAQFLIDKLGLAKAVRAAAAAIACQGQLYAPVITTPYQLKEKLSQLVLYYQREKNKKNNYIKL